MEWQVFERLAAVTANPLGRQILRTDSRRTKRWEIEAVAKFERVLCLSEYDRNQLVSARPDLRPRVVTWPVPVPEHAVSRPRGKRKSFRVLILGSLRSPARAHGTRWFVDHVWEECRRELSDAKLDVVGADPPSDLLELDGVSGIRVWGFLQDIETLLQDVSVCAIPLFAGAGIRVKVLELISRGIPCIGTASGLQGLEHIAGTVRADTVTEWKEALREANRGLSSLRKEAELGRDAVKRTHSHQRATEVLREQVEQAVAYYR